MSTEGELLDEVTPELVRRIETALAEGTTDEVRHLLAGPDASGQASMIDCRRNAGDLPDDVYDLFVVDSGGRLRGSVPLGRMLRSGRPVPVLDIVDPDIPSAPATTDQAEMAHLFRDKNLVSCPVVSRYGRQCRRTDRHRRRARPGRGRTDRHQRPALRRQGGRRRRTERHHLRHHDGRRRRALVLRLAAGRGD